MVYFMTLLYLNEDIKSRMNSGNVCYHTVHSLLSCVLISKNMKTETHRTINLLVETWSHTLREKHRLRVFKNMALRRIFGSKTDDVTADWRKLHNLELHDLYSSPNNNLMTKPRTMRRAWHVARVWGGWRAPYRVLVGGNLRERENLEHLGIGDEIILKRILKRDWLEGRGLFSLRLGTSGWLL